ncbi:MAG: hypothetical protein G01um101420_516 [Parcubacteria group bacterium Gr01-1014_20]|nr:MAG: hypothetical protein G01um101420_516 [Parcubacteria group bacterium Gr01-1014_20]
MGYPIKYWTREELDSGEAETTSEPLTVEIIEDPDDLRIDSICHDVNGAAWGVIEIIKPNGESELDFGDSKLTSILPFLENLANEEDWVIFILEGVDPVSVERETSKPISPKLVRARRRKNAVEKPGSPGSLDATLKNQ